MLIDLTPLARYRDFRLLFVGQLVSFFGSMLTYVAVPWQLYELTRQSWIVGLVGVAQLVPTLAFGLLGGSFADRFDRRRLLVACEAAMGALTLLLAWNARRAAPSVALVFAVAAALQGVAGFHRPAMEAMTQKLVAEEHYAAIGALGGLRYSLGAVAGPALAGVLLAWGGAAVTYAIDAATFAVAVVALAKMRAGEPPAPRVGGHASAILEGLRYALGRPELVGTYVIDIVAMTFAFPVALFPEMATRWGGARASGVLFSAMSVGTGVMTLFSGWTARVRRRGAAVVIAAAAWGLFVVGAGLAPSLAAAAACLALAGAADMVSGLFRGVIWNETIPNEMRGRMAGVEMISYMTGPLLGNARAGWMASAFSVKTSLVAGGAVCLVAVAVTGAALRAFWRYTSAPRADA